MRQKALIEFGMLFMADALFAGYWYEGLQFDRRGTGWSRLLTLALFAAGLWCRDSLAAKVERWSVRIGPDSRNEVKRRFAKWSLWRYSLFLLFFVILFLRAPGGVAPRLIGIGIIAVLCGVLIRDSYKKMKAADLIQEVPSLDETQSES